MDPIKSHPDFEALIKKALKKSAEANVHRPWWCSRNIFQNVVAGLLVAAMLGGGAYLWNGSEQKQPMPPQPIKEENVADDAKQTQAL